MKVFCRFAPPTTATPAVVDDDDAAATTALLRLLIQSSLSKGNAHGATTTTARGRADRGEEEEVHLLDPLTGSSATFGCAGVFLPPPTAARLESSLPLDRGEEDGFLGEQARVYERVCRGFLPPKAAPPRPSAAASGGVRRNALLAYGQTASGKTHTLFGSITTQRRAERRSGRSSNGNGTDLGWWAAQLRSPTAGLVPRYLADLFDGRQRQMGGGDGNSGAFAIDISCFEVYNEVTTDLVALSVERGQRRSKAAADKSQRRTTGGAFGRRRASSNTNVSLCSSIGSATSDYCDSAYDDDDDDGEYEIAIEEINTTTGAGADFSVEAAAQRYREEEDEESSHNHQQQQQQPRHALLFSRRASVLVSSTADKKPQHQQRTAYKPTEKGQVLSAVLRARCGSAVEAWVVLSALLVLRRRSETARNASSSRSHLLIRLEARVLTGGQAAEANKNSSSRETAPPVVARMMATPHGPMPAPSMTPPGPRWELVNETLFCDLAGSESYRSLAAVGGGNNISVGSGFARSGGNTSQLSGHSSMCGSSDLDSSSISTADPDSQYSGGGGHAPSHPHRRTARQLAEAERRRATRGREMRNINASLLTLRKVIHAFHLVSTGQAGGGGGVIHAPFKESALTTILEPYLVLPGANTCGGNSAAPSPSPSSVALVVCCSSRQADFHETVASLRLGAEASSVRPRVVVQAIPQYREREQQRQRQVEQQRAGVGWRTHSAPSRAAAAADSKDDTTAATATATVAELTEQLTAARAAALHRDAATAALTLQFAELCGHYRECVGELTAAKGQLHAKDAVIAELMGQLRRREGEAGERGRGGGDQQQRDRVRAIQSADDATAAAVAAEAPPTPWTATRDVEVSPSSAYSLMAADTTTAAIKEEEERSGGRGADPATRLFPPLSPPAASAGRSHAAMPLPPPPPTPSPPSRAADYDNDDGAVAEATAATAAAVAAQYLRMLQRPPLAEVTNRPHTHPSTTAAAAVCKENVEESGSPAVPTAAPCRVYKL